MANKVAPTQEHLDIAEIKEGIVILKSGAMRMILMVSSINFALKSEQEQNAIISSYQNFINSLTFPVQIIMQSRRLDLDRYIIKLNQRLAKEVNPLIQLQTQDYIEFINRLISIANIMDKRFYIVIPFSPTNVAQQGLFNKLFGGKSAKPSFSDAQFKSYKEELAQRANVITSGLSAMGVRAVPLTTQQVVELFYSTYNPEESTKERLDEVENLESAVVEKENKQ